MVICGLAGARLFFVIQNRDYFFSSSQSFSETIGALLDMTQGGLVVYGSMIGALLAAAFVIWKWKMPIWKTADLIAPGMALGLAIGRIGCLLNGCCWGGVCEAPLPGIQFPAGSPPYMQQLNNGTLLGIESKVDPNDARKRTVTSVGKGLGKEIGIKAGDSIEIPGFEGDQIRHIAGTPFALQSEFEIKNARVGKMRFSMNRLATKSLAVHPTQIYSSINAFVLCGLLWFYWYVRRSDGEVMALMLMLYPVSRFVLELIRNDESGQFGTELTISQWVSLLTITAGIGLFAWVRMFGSKDEIEPKNQYNRAN
jgi:phosphatidylglycerol:prolipoprotein diacylglycerol transferase